MDYKKVLTRDAFSRDVMHFAASRDHPHCQLVDHEDAPVDILGIFLLCFLLYGFVHNFCNKKTLQ